MPTPVVPSILLSVAPGNVRTGGTATYTVTASFANPLATVTVNYSMGGSAVRGSQYNLSASQFTIPAGSTSANVTLTALTGRKRAKSAIMTLAGGNGYSLTGSSSAIVTITN